MSLSASHATWNEVHAHLAGNGLAVLPFGVCEQHDSHLPLNTDTVLAQALAAAIAERLGARAAATARRPRHRTKSRRWAVLTGEASIGRRFSRACCPNSATAPFSRRVSIRPWTAESFGVPPGHPSPADAARRNASASDDIARQRAALGREQPAGEADQPR